MVLWLLLCVLFCVICLWVTRRRTQESLLPKLPPAYPDALPIIGHTHLVFTAPEKLWENVQLLAEESLKQGGVIYGTFGPELFYVITDPDDCLTASNACLQKHYSYRFATFMRDGLFTSSVETWKRHRKLLNPTFSLPVVIGFLDIFNSQAKVLVKKVEPYAGRGDFDLYKHIKSVSSETFCWTAFGARGVKDMILKFLDATDRMLDLAIDRFMKLHLHSNLIYKLTGHAKAEKETLKMFDDLYEKIIKDKQTHSPFTPKTKNGERYTPILDRLLSLSNELTEDEIKDEVVNAIGAGFDTTAIALMYAIFLLGAHGDVQDKLYKEIIDVLGPDGDVDKDNVNKLVYTEAVLKEGLRYYVGAPVLLRQVDKEVKLIIKLYDFVFQKTTQCELDPVCLLLPAGTNYHPMWGPDRYEFKPERFLDASIMPNANAFGSFSWGKRSCIGKTYALITMKITLAHFIRHYRVKTKDINSMKLRLIFILKLGSGYEVSIEKRNK